jgi:D-glycero-alpha-D-manno-heptose 1-phosphate guanylyltransferase
MEAIVLAGGLGTRLQSVVSDVSKPMAEINRKPFLAYLLDYLLVHEISKVILCVGYKKELIQAYFQSEYKGIEIVYSVEEIFLGTGGAIKQALSMTQEKKVLVFNGDTLFDVDLKKFVHAMQTKKIALALKPMRDFERYGSVTLQGDMICLFEEKKFTKQGFINGGVYLMETDVFKVYQEDIFSFESFLETQNELGGFVCDGYFIDIGIPVDYKKAQQDFKEMF